MLNTDAERHKERRSRRSKGEADLLANNELMVGAKMRGLSPSHPRILRPSLLPKLIGYNINCFLFRKSASKNLQLSDEHKRKERDHEEVAKIIMLDLD